MDWSEFSEDQADGGATATAPSQIHEPLMPGSKPMMVDGEPTFIPNFAVKRGVHFHGAEFRKRISKVLEECIASTAVQKLLRQLPMPIVPPEESTVDSNKYGPLDTTDELLAAGANRPLKSSKHRQLIPIRCLSCGACKVCEGASQKDKCQNCKKCSECVVFHVNEAKKLHHPAADASRAMGPYQCGF